MVSENFFAYSCVSEHLMHFYFFPTKTYIFLADKTPPPPLRGYVLTNECFFWTAPLVVIFVTIFFFLLSTHNAHPILALLCQLMIAILLFPDIICFLPDHPLARHGEILSAIETRISLLGMTFMKYVEHDLCCFIPGKVIDEIYAVLRKIQNVKCPSRSCEVLQVGGFHNVNIFIFKSRGEISQIKMLKPEVRVKIFYLRDFSTTFQFVRSLYSPHSSPYHFPRGHIYLLT